jgi:hypothetical protein
MNDDEKTREALIGEFERCRAPVLRIADAAKRAALATDALEWALWATDPKSHEPDARFNHAYAAQELAKRTPEWREAVGDLAATLDDDADRLAS